MTRLPHACRICKVPLELHQHEDCPQFSAETLKKLVVCNRCGEFRKAFWRIEAVIKALCMKVWNERSRTEPDGDVISECRRRLIDATRALCARTCDHYRLQFFWEEDFAAQLMEQPQMVFKILAIYERSVAKMREPLSEQWAMKESNG